MIKKWFFFFLLTSLTTPLFSAPLPANKVFQLSAKVTGPNTLMLNWSIHDHYFLYKNRIQIQELNKDEVHLGPLSYPKADKKILADGSSVAIYRQTLQLPVAILGLAPGESLLSIQYQGCSDDGFCYPPTQQAIKLSFNGENALTTATLENEINVKPLKQTSSPINTLFANPHTFIILLSFFGMGLLLSFTPCVLPMIPVLSGLIVGHEKTITTRKAFLLSLSYVLSMASTYAVIGAIAALLGHNLQLTMQSPIVISLLSLIFVLLALSMFGFYNLRLPLSWQNKLANLTRSQHGGHYLSAAVMGCLSTLVLSPCVTAPLIGAISYITHTGHLGFGALALFFLGLGMGMPLLIIGTSAGKLLPKAGEWMNTVKSFFGVLMLAVAIYLISRILPPSLGLFLWGALLIGWAISWRPFVPAAPGIDTCRQTSAIVLLLYGLLMIIGASQGHKDPLQPLATQTTTSPFSSQQVVTSLNEVKKALARARGKPVLLDFYADWCTTCKVISNTVLSNKAVDKTLTDMHVIIADVTKNDSHSKALLRYFNVIAPPALLFFTAQGKEIPTLRLNGETNAKELITQLHKVKTVF